MSLHEHTERLRGAVRDLLEQTSVLRVTLTEDVPGDPADRPALVDLLSDVCDTLSGWLEVALEALEGVADVSSTADTARAVAHAHAHLCLVREQLGVQLTTWERFTQLYALTERRGEWPAWVWTLGAQITRLQEGAARAERAVLAAWTDLSDHLTGDVRGRTTHPFTLEPHSGARECGGQPHSPACKEVSHGSQS